MLLMLTCSISGKAIDLVQVDDRMAGTAEVSASLSSCSSTSDNSIDKKNSLFTNTKFAWTTEMCIRDRYYALTGSDYYIYTLRRILI